MPEFFRVLIRHLAISYMALACLNTCKEFHSNSSRNGSGYITDFFLLEALMAFLMDFQTLITYHSKNDRERVRKSCFHSAERN